MRLNDEEGGVWWWVGGVWWWVGGVWCVDE